MKRFNLAIAAVAAVCVAFVAACSGSTPQAEEAAIKEINKTWLEAIVAKDAKKIAAIYAEDGQMLPPNAPKAVGRDAIEKGWEQFLAVPGMSLTFETQSFVVAKSGDIAVEVQTYKFASGEGAAAVTDTGKGVVTWTKRDGKWHVFTDMFSSDAPPPAPAPAAAPAASAVPEGMSDVPDVIAPATPAPAPAKPPGQ
jgi:uncharacterized protein (TIGR02246 family)